MDQKQVCAAVMRCLNRLRLTEAFCDITLLVGDVPIPAHKAVLAGTSKFFHSVLSSDQTTDMFQINGMSAPDMVKVLDFLYTGQILVNKNNVVAIETMAEQLQIDILTELCTTFRSQQQKKAPPAKPASTTKGTSRTRTYTRWGRQHTLRPGDSSGEEDSDNDELTLLGDDQGKGSSYNINMALTGNANCDRVQTEQILLESIRRSNIESPKRKSAPKTSRNRAPKRQRTNTKAQKQNKKAGYPQCETSLVPESLSVGTHISQRKVNHNLEAQDEVCPTSTLTPEDFETHMNSAECVANQNEEVDPTGESSNPMDTIMQEVCKVVDLAGMSVYRQHDLTVTSISDTPAGHVLISDTGVETELGSLLDIQSLLSSYSTSGQPIILTTCDEEGAIAATNDAEQAHCDIDLVTEVDQTAHNPSGVDEENLCQDLMMAGQPVILTICEGDDVAARNGDAPCCVDLVAALDQTVDNDASGVCEQGLSQGLMMEGQPVILTICDEEGEGAAARNDTEQSPCCVDLVSELDPAVGGDQGQDLMVASQPVILTICEGGNEDVAARNDTEQTRGDVDLVAEVNQTVSDPPGVCEEDLTNLVMVGQPAIVTPCEEGTETKDPVVELVAEVDHHSPRTVDDALPDADEGGLYPQQSLMSTTSDDIAATNSTEQTPCDVDPAADEENNPDLTMSPTPGHVSEHSSVEVVDNLQKCDMSTISNPAEAEAGFHDYCLITDSVKDIQKSCVSESKSQVRDLIREMENDKSDSECQVSESITGLEDNDTAQEIEQDNVTLLLESSEEQFKASVPVSSDCPSISVKKSSDISETQIAEEETADISAVRSQSMEVNEVDDTPWNDTHVVLVQKPKKKKRRLNKTAEESSPLPCPWCPVTFNNSNQLRGHTKDSHRDSMYTCTFCTRTFIEEDRRDKHMDWCRVGEKVSGRYRCPLCSYSAAKALFVVNHYRVKHTNRCQRTCDRCHQVFNTLDNYYDHQLQVHREDIAQVCRRKVYTCEVCYFRTVKGYLLKSHMTGHSEKRFSCKQCEKTFKTTLILKRHEKFIHSTELLGCSKCEFSSKYAATLKSHEYRTHDIKAAEQSVHHCHYCDYSHVDRSNLSKHERFKHSDERPFLCSFCPTSFKHKHQMTVHERSHTGLRPFQCTLCPYAGRSKFALQTHHNYRHSESKPFGCDLCGFHTKAASNLMSHKARCLKRQAARLKSPGVTRRKKF